MTLTFFEADIVSRIKAKKITSANQTLADWLTKYVNSKEDIEPSTTKEQSKADEETNDISLENVVFGYYLIITSFENSGDKDKATAINQSILNVPQDDNITLKYTPITIEKKVKKAGTTDFSKNTSASINDVLNYEVDSKIMDLSSYDLSKYTPTLDVDVKSSNDIKSNVLKYQGDPAKPSAFHYVFSDMPKYQKVDIESVTIDVVNDKEEETEETSYTTYNVYCVKKIVAEGETSEPEYYFIKGEIDGITLVQKEDGKLKVNDVTAAQLNTIRNKAFARVTMAEYNDDCQQFFAINFNLKALKDGGIDGKDIKISYNTWITKDAENSGIDNAATLDFSNNPYDESGTGKVQNNDDTPDPDNPDPDDKTKVYTYDFEIDKVFSDGNKSDFDKLYFELFSNATLENKIEFIKPTEPAEGDPEVNVKFYVKADKDTKSTDKTTELTLSSTGKLQLHGLGAGTYYLKETYKTYKDTDGKTDITLSKKGYSVINTATITISPYYEVKTNEDGTEETTYDTTLRLWHQDTVTEGEGESAEEHTIWGIKSTVKIDNVSVNLEKVAKDSDINNYAFKFDVVNQKGFSLPVTGENGNWFFAIAGILLVTSGAVLIIFLFRKKKSDNN